LVASRLAGSYPTSSRDPVRATEPVRLDLSIRLATSYESEYLAGRAVIDPFKQSNTALDELLHKVLVDTPG
jgi:hypothetical protein